MPRELNLQVFDEGKPSPVKKAKEDWNRPQDLVNTKLVQEIQSMKGRIRELETQVRDLNQKTLRQAEIMQKGHQHTQHSHKNLESLVKHHVQDLASRISNVTGRFTESRVHENKTQELFDRHNQIVQKFEVRMQQMQKLISQQDMKLINYKSVIDEIRKKGL